MFQLDMFSLLGMEMGIFPIVVYTSWSSEQWPLMQFFWEAKKNWEAQRKKV